MMAAPGLPRNRHVAYLVLGLLVPLLGSVLVVQEREQIAFRFAPELPLPSTCLSRSLLGVRCPACGLTRSIVYLTHGDFASSLSMHRLGWAVFLLIVAQVPLRIWCLASGAAPVLRSRTAEITFWAVLISLLLVNRMLGVLAEM
jgi:hypothetical protein